MLYISLGRIARKDFVAKTESIILISKINSQLGKFTVKLLTQLVIIFFKVH